MSHGPLPSYRGFKQGRPVTRARAASNRFYFLFRINPGAGTRYVAALVEGIQFTV